MARLSPHINFNGNAEEAFIFSNQHLAASTHSGMFMDKYGIEWMVGFDSHD
jgi:uncharacterized glyoxalase superfamily protein PhnB